MLYLSANAIRSMQMRERNQWFGIKILAQQSPWKTLRNATQRGKTNTACGMKFDCQTESQRKRERRAAFTTDKE
jgi:hypothetical protein